MTKTLTFLLAVLTLASINNPTLASTCNGPFSDPVLQRYAAKALADVRLLSPHLSPNGILNSFAQKLGDLVYEGRSRYADPLGLERFREYMRTASFDIWEGCFPELASLIAAAKQRDAVAEKEKADARAQHDAEARKPENRLLTAYKRYAYVKYCNESRQGYAAVYINEIELDKARTAVKAIEDDALKENANLDTEAIWKRANILLSGAPINRDQCQFTFSTLLQQFTGTTGDTLMKKDF